MQKIHSIDRLPRSVGGDARLGDGLRTFNDQWGVRGLARGAVVVVLSGGTSKGAGDLSHRIVSKLGEPGILVHGVALKPGKPICLGAVGATPVPYRATRDYDGERLLSEFPELGRRAGASLGVISSHSSMAFSDTSLRAREIGTLLHAEIDAEFRRRQVAAGELVRFGRGDRGHIPVRQTARASRGTLGLVDRAR